MKNQIYGTEKGYGKKITSWLNEQAQSDNLDLEIFNGDSLVTQNFGDFDLFFLSDDSIPVRKLIQKAGKRFNVKMIEGGYEERARIIRRKKSDYAKVLKGDKVIGHLELESSRFGSTKWEIKSEERR